MFILQDLFGVIPGDTDYRIFAQDYGKIPGLDVIFLLGGYFYHTSSDTLERLLYELDLLPWYIFFFVVTLDIIGLYAVTYPCYFLQTDLEAFKRVETICLV